MREREPAKPPSSQREENACPGLMRLAVILRDWTRAEFEVSSYEFCANGSLVVHFEDGGVQTFRPGDWIDVHRSPCPDLGQGDTRLRLT